MMAKEIYLIVIMWFNGGGILSNIHQMPSWERCVEATKSAVVNVSHGNESEAMAVVYCSHDKPEKGPGSR